MLKYLSSVVIILTVVNISSANDASYAVLVPKMLRCGSDFNVSVTVLKSVGDVTVTAQLRDSTQNVIIQNLTVVSAGSTKKLILKIPNSLSETAYELRVSADGGLQFEQSANISVKSKTLSLFVQTDKAIYKPGQKVLYRAIAVYPNLKPYKGAIDIAVYDNAGNKIAQLLQQVNETGVVSGDLTLSEQTPLGQWKIEVKAEGNKIEKKFEVAEYVLPKFKVNIDLPSYYFINYNQKSRQSDLTFSVSAKYTYGQPVKGSVSVIIQVLPSPWDSSTFPQKIVTATLSDGKLMMTIPIDQILPLVNHRSYYGGDNWRTLSYQSLLVIANVTETATGKMLSSNDSVICRDRRYDLKFLEISPSNYKPGLVYTGYLQLSQVDNMPPLSSDVGGLVTLSVSTRKADSTTVNQKFDITVPESGLMPFTLNIEHNANMHITLQASFKDTSNGLDVSDYKSLVQFVSRDNDSIQLTVASSSGVIKPDETVTFHIKLTTPLTSFTYQILSKGSILLGDTVTEASPSVNHQLKLTFSQLMTQYLMPTARIVVWTVTTTGEIISDSLEVTVDASFANKVSLSFSEAKVEPGDHVSLTVNAYQKSYIGLLAVDQSVLLLKSGNDLTQSMVFDDLKQYDASSKQSSYAPLWRGCYMPWPIYSGGQDSSEVFDNAGIIVMTDAYILKQFRREQVYMMDMAFGRRAPMVAAAAPDSKTYYKLSSSPSSNEQQPSIQPRVEFPETWLWSDTLAGDNGSATIDVTVPDTITSWVASAFAVSDDMGLGIAPINAQLTVFKPFFVSINLPYSVIRGEEFALQVTIFNYISSQLEVLVVLHKSTDFRVRHVNAVEPEEIELTENVLVPANDAKSVYFWIVPKSLGQIPIEVQARSNAAADAERRLLLVKPEGATQEYSTSVFIDLTNSREYNTTLFVSLPPSGVVPDSQYIDITVIGDLLGPSINGLDSLIQMPFGCGEQNMLNFAPNIYVLNYLTSTDQLTTDIVDKSKRYMTAGYQRELTYQRSDGSFSAFGNSDPAGSIWLSSFVAKCFHEAKDYIPIEDQKISQTLQWIINLQTANGSFSEPPNGRVIHTDMQGGSSQGVALTAYVLVALLENNDTQQINKNQYSMAVNKARIYLENQLEKVDSDPYALSIISYALLLAGSSRAQHAVNKLNNLAMVQDGLKHWEKMEPESKTDSRNIWRPPYTQSRSVNIEMTSYALLTYSLLKDISAGVPIAKWIIAQRNPNGGFSSTQDTVMALQALAAFSSLTSAPSGEDSELNLRAVFGDSSHEFQPVTRQNALVMQTVQIPPIVEQVLISAHGSGVGLVQLNVKYNKYTVDTVSGVVLTLSTDQQNNVISLYTCGRWTNADQPSGMVVMDINQLTGFSAVNIDELRQQVGPQLKRIDTDENKIVLYFDELTGANTCLTLKSEKVQMVNNVQKAAVKLYSYYDPSSVDTAFYVPPEAAAQTNWCSTCPQCCGQPEPQPIHSNTAPRSATSHVTWAGLLATLTVASLLSCLVII